MTLSENSCVPFDLSGDLFCGTFANRESFNQESDQDIPPGWLLENEDESNEKVFVNSVTQERWKACKTSEGQTYYYNIDDDVTETAWQLPRVEVKKRSIRRRSMDDLAEDTKRLTSSMSSSTFPRNSKCKSVVLDYTAGSYQRDSAVFRGPSSSPDLLKKNHRRSQSAFSYDSFGFSSSELTLGEGKATNIPEREGYLSRKKLVEAGKSKKSHWEQVYVCKYGGTLVFYKDQKSATPRPDFPTGKPESSIDLHGAILDTPAKDKVKGKKNVFQLWLYFSMKAQEEMKQFKEELSEVMDHLSLPQPNKTSDSSENLILPSQDEADGTSRNQNRPLINLSTYKGSTVMLLMAETTLAMAGWLTPIQNTITKLETEEPLPQMTSLGTDVNNESADSSMSSLSPLSKQPATPTTPTMQTKEKANTTSRSNSTGKDDSKFNIKRRLSKRAGTGEEAEKDKTKIKDKLRKFIIKRPSYSELEKKGIIKQEVFGCHLGKLCQREKCNVPNFVVKCIETVDRKGLNMRGIYRECGNASTMHKLRILIDQGQPVDFNDKQWSDVHMIAGALKWYFRELPDPLIPFDKFDEYVNAIKFPILQERVKRFRDLSKRLPMPNYETLVLLMGHLKRVVEHSSQNKMEAQNVGIVFGPTLLRPEDEEGVMNIALNTVYQNQIVQLMVLEFSAIFDQR